MALLFRRTVTTLAARRSSCGNTAQINLTGRDFVVPGNLTSSEIKSMLWTAMDLKYCKKQNCNINFEPIQNARVTLLLDKACTKTQLALQNATKYLKTNLNVLIDGSWECNFQKDLDDYGRLLACYSDIIFCKHDCQDNIQNIANGSHVSVITTESFDFSILKVLADLMTMQERYGHLKGLTMAWVGVHGPLINTYLSILPRLGINIRYYCVDECSQCVSPVLLKTGMKYSAKHGSEIHECDSVAKAVYRADVVATASHCQDKITVTKCHMDEASLNWGLLDTLPRGHEVEKELITHKNSLVLKSLQNAEWIYAAFILRFLICYEHLIQQPTFDDIEATCV